MTRNFKTEWLNAFFLSYFSLNVMTVVTLSVVVREAPICLSLILRDAGLKHRSAQ